MRQVRGSWIIACLLAIPGICYSATDCQLAVRGADSAAQDVRRAARAVGQMCSDGGSSCTDAVASLDGAILSLQQARNSLLEACQADVSTPTAPQPGELVISEINVATPNGAGWQWFEVYNSTDRTLDLLGLSVLWVDDTNQLHSGVITSGSTTVPPQSYRVIALYAEKLTADATIPGGVAVLDTQLTFLGTVWLGGIAAGSPNLTIMNGTQVIDNVTWGLANGFASSEMMISRQLDPDALTASLNDFVNVPGENNNCPTGSPLVGQCVWCSSTMNYSVLGTTAYGTPGLANDQCPGVGPTP